MKYQITTNTIDMCVEIRVWHAGQTVTSARRVRAFCFETAEERETAQLRADAYVQGMQQAAEELAALVTMTRG